MPPAVGIVAGLATIGLGTALGIGFLAKIGVSLLLSAASNALAKKDKSPTSIVSSGRTQMIRQPITTWRIIYGQVRVSGPITFIHTSVFPTGEANKQLQLIVTLASHQCEEVGEVWLDNEILPTFVDPTPSGRWANGAKFYRSRGTTADDTALGNGIRTQAPDTPWTTDHRQTGHSKIAALFFYNKSLFPGSIPKVSCIVKGRKVYDPRDGGQDYNDPSTWLYSNNAALCLLDYIVGYQLNSDGVTRVPLGLGEDISGIDTASFITAANVCDESVSLQGGGTEPRYTCNGTIDTSEAPKDIIGKLLTAMGGKLVRSGGFWTAYAAAYQTPTVTLTEDDLEGPVKITSRLSRRELFNTVKGVYVSPDHLWQPVDLPPLQSATFLAEDQGEELLRDVGFPFTTSPSTAQRLMKIDLFAARQQISVALTCKLTTFRVLAGDNIMLTLARYGWTSKVFEVKNWKFSISSAGEAPRLGVDLLLRETAAAVYDWSSSEEDPVDPAPDTDFPDAATVESPSNLIVVEELYVTLDGVTVKAKAVLDWTASPDAFFDEYQVEWRLSTDPDWMVAGRTDTETFEILDVAPGTYDFRVKAVNLVGVSSDYASLFFVDFLGVSAAPADMTGLTLSKMGGVAILRWDLATDLDVRVGGQVLFRHDQDTVSPTWGTSVAIGDFVPGSETVAILPLKPGTYLAKFMDQSGVVSVNAATVPTDGATILEYGSASQIDEHPDFDGVHNNTIAIDDILKLDGVGLFDDIPDLDLVNNLDSFGGIQPSGVYDFFFSFDLGSVTRVRLRTILTVAVENVLDEIDSRAALVDTWADWDGAGVADGMDLQVWVRATDDDPGGAPVWGPFERLESAEFENRAFEFQARLFSNDPAYNILCSELTVKKEELV